MGMNLIDNQFASTTSGQPWIPVQDIDFLQYGIRDASAATIESIIGSAYDPAKSYIIKGCVKSSSGGTTSISAGYIFGIAKALGSMVTRTYLYTVAAQSFPDPAGADVVVADVTAFPQSYDPVTFSDGATHSIHNEWRVVFSTGASGSGDIDFDDLVNVTDRSAELYFSGDTVSDAVYGFERNETFWFNNAPPADPVINVVFDNASIGKELVIHTALPVLSLPVTITIVGSLAETVTVVELSGDMEEGTTVPTAVNMRLKYLGTKTNTGSPEEYFSSEVKWFY